MKNNKNINKHVAFVEEAYEQEYSVLCDRLVDREGEIEHPVLYKILCDRVNVKFEEKKVKVKKLKGNGGEKIR